MKTSLGHFVFVSTTSALLSWSGLAELVDDTTRNNEPAFWQKADPTALEANQPIDPFGESGFDRDWRHQDHKLAAGPDIPMHLRQTTFRVPAEVGTAIRAEAGGQEDGALFQQLSDLSERGEVRIVADFNYGASGGQTADQAATQEFIYPTEWSAFAAQVAVAGMAFETRNLGTSCSLIPRVRQDAMRMDAQVERVRWVGFSSWLASPVMPVAGQPRSCLVRLPVFLDEKMTGVGVLRSGAAALMGLQPEAVLPGSTEKVAAWLYTFVRVDVAEPASSAAASAPAAEGDDVVLELIVFPTARDEAARWLAERGAEADDSTELASWEKRAGKSASGAASRWLLRAATGPLRPGGPPRTTVESTGEFVYPTEFDPGIKGEKMFCPTAFETRNCGSSFAAQATWAADGKSALVSFSFEDVTMDEIEDWPTRLNEPLFHIEQPLFHVSQLITEVAVPVNGVRFIGSREARAASRDAGADDDRDCELLFLKVHGTPHVIAPEAKPAPPVVEAQAVVFSVPAAMAARLAHEGDEGRRIEALWEGQSDGDVKIVDLSAGVVCVGGTLKNSDIFETIFPMETEIETVTAGFLGLSAFESQVHGGEFNLRPRVVGGAVEAKADLQWESAPPSRPTEEQYRQFCESKKGDIPKPRFFEEKGVVEGAVVPSDGQWHLLSFQECSAPEGAPEHGRWHAALVRVVQH